MLPKIVKKNAFKFVKMIKGKL